MIIVDVLVDAAACSKVVCSVPHPFVVRVSGSVLIVAHRDFYALQPRSIRSL